MASLVLDEKAPDFEMDDFKGDRLKLSNFQGKSNVLIVLNRGFV